jgi:hypothetical protein
MKALRNAIYAKCAGSSLDTLINGQIFYGKAPAGTRYPYVVFSRVTGNLEKTFTEEYDNPLIQFSVFSANATSSNEAHDIAEAVKSLYDECSLTITGSALIVMEIKNDQGPMEDDSISQDGADGGWACFLDFEITALKN